MGAAGQCHWMRFDTLPLSKQSQLGGRSSFPKCPCGTHNERKDVYEIENSSFCSVQLSLDHIWWRWVPHVDVEGFRLVDLKTSRPDAVGNVHETDTEKLIVVISGPVEYNTRAWQGGDIALWICSTLQANKTLLVIILCLLLGISKT